jgi:hypothetical protein
MQEIENIDLQLEAINLPIGMLGNTIGNNSAVDKYSLSVHPVPFNDKLDFDFKLSTDTDVKILIFNNLGQLILERSESLSKGFHTIELNTNLLQPSSLFWYTFEVEGVTTFGKAVKI